MKILRKLRRRKIKLSFIFLLLLVFIFNTYAWWSTSNDTGTGNLALNVSSWDVAFVVNNEEIKTEEYTFTVEEFYPGIATKENPITKTIDVWNIGDASTYLKFEITEIYLYGMKILDRQIDEETTIPETIGQKTTNTLTKTTTADMFGNESATIFNENNTYYKVLLEQKENQEDNVYNSFYLKYPTTFTIGYEYGFTHIEGAGRDNEVGSRSQMNIKLAWENNEANNLEDTRLGNLVYQFENAKDAEGNLIHAEEPALKIVARVTATKDEESSGTSYVD